MLLKNTWPCSLNEQGHVRLEYHAPIPLFRRVRPVFVFLLQQSAFHQGDEQSAAETGAATVARRLHHLQHALIGVAEGQQAFGILFLAFWQGGAERANLAETQPVGCQWFSVLLIDRSL